MDEAFLSWRTNIILAALVVGLFAYIGFFESKKLGSDDYKGRHDRVLAGFAEEKVIRIAIRPAAGDAIELVRGSDEEHPWTITRPEEAIADADVVRAFLDIWEYGNALRRLQDVAPSELTSFGLEPPSAAIELYFLDGSRTEIRLGKGDTVAAGRYLIALPNPDVVVVDHSVSEAFDRKVDNFRFKSEDLDTLKIQDAGS